MGLEVEHRPSPSPYVARVWRSRSSGVARMAALAHPRWDLVFWEEGGRVSAAVQGPESVAAVAPVPQDATFVGITFALGTTLAHHPVARLVDGSAEVPDVTRRSFRLGGSSWHRPTYDNAESLVRALVREGVLVRDPVVAEAAAGGSPDLSLRSLQRRFVSTTGLTAGAVRRIDRAREAAVLVQEGVPLSDVVHRLGYFDQPHLARSLRRFVGRTATELRSPTPDEPLSLLYKT